VVTACMSLSKVM